MSKTIKLTSRRLFKDRPSADCVLYLPGEGDAYGSIIRDISGKANHGTITQATWTRLSRGLWTLSYDGNDDLVTVAHNANQLLTSGGTFMAWINPLGVGGGGAGRIFDKASAGSGANGYAIYFSLLPAIYVQVNLGTQVPTGTIANLFDGTWKFYTLTLAANATVTHYINGVVSGTPAATGALAGITTTTNLIVGGAAWAARTFNGKMAIERILNPTVLTAAEILSIYNRERWMFGV